MQFPVEPAVGDEGREELVHIGEEVHPHLVRLEGSRDMIDPDANEARVRFAADIEIVLGHFLEHDADVEFRHDPAVDAGQRLRDALLVVSGEGIDRVIDFRSEEHTSELQSLMRISYAVFCLKKTKTITVYTSEQYEQ